MLELTGQCCRKVAALPAAHSKKGVVSPLNSTGEVTTRVLDDIDRRLLSMLQTDARISVRRLARAIGMSAGAVGERLGRLEARGVIRGYGVDLDPQALGLGLQVLVGLQVSQRRSISATVNELLAVDEVVEVKIVTGRWDLFVVLLLRDQIHLRDVLLSSIWVIPDFQHSESMIVLDQSPDSQARFGHWPELPTA